MGLSRTCTLRHRIQTFLDQVIREVVPNGFPSGTNALIGLSAESPRDRSRRLEATLRCKSGLLPANPMDI